MKILSQAEETPIVFKTKELCQTILDQPAYQELRRQISVFLQNRDAVEQYRRLCDKQDVLQSKQEEGQSISTGEMADFEQEEKAFLANPLAAAFIDAQRQMHKIEQTVAQYVRRTFELGRLPESGDFGDEGCGCGSGGCGCH
jgi:cell fate (sporulation/competence/biofilm development) regulator YlbF (YheA/YmcA/DUF963 family)